MVYNIISIAAFSYVFMTFPLITSLRDKLHITKSKRRFLMLINKLLSCALCCGFWIGLIATHNIFEASIISILSELIFRFMRFFNPL